MKHSIFILGCLAAITLAQSCAYKKTGRCSVHVNDDWQRNIFDGSLDLNLGYCGELCPLVSNHAGDWELNLTDAAVGARRTLIENDHCRLSLSRSSGSAGDPLNIVLANDDILSILDGAVTYYEAMNNFIGWTYWGITVDATCDGKNFTYWVE